MQRGEPSKDQHRHTTRTIDGPRRFQPGGQQTWRWAGFYSIPVARYLGKRTNGAATLKEELEADIEGIRIPSVVGWIGRATNVKARCNGGMIRALSPVFAVLEEANFSHLRRNGLRHLDFRYDVEIFEEIQPDAFCGRCSGWGCITSLTGHDRDLGHVISLGIG